MFLDGFPGLAALVERRLEQAAANGELSGLPGEGRPLELDDDALVPPELRVAYRIVKNAGFLPPELADIAEVHQLIGAIGRGELEPGARRLRALLIHLEASGRPMTATRAWHDYEAALRRRLDREGSG
ncbi:MAG TPA: DnaJ family domain-containing protein [Burkholderiaceae bacterium]|nr:DnaJ family domain-containing protein [Burkholderiaceae bacterium]